MHSSQRARRTPVRPTMVPPPSLPSRVARSRLDLVVDHHKNLGPMRPLARVDHRGHRHHRSNRRRPMTCTRIDRTVNRTCLLRLRLPRPMHRNRTLWHPVQPPRSTMSQVRAMDLRLTLMLQTVMVKRKNHRRTPTHLHPTRTHRMSYEPPMLMQLMKPLLAQTKPVTRATYRIKTQNMCWKIHHKNVLTVHKLWVLKA